jgi:putative oxidoreductase
MKDFLAEYRVLLSYPRHLVLLVSRWIVAYGFTLPALMKVHDIEATGKWFESVGIPFAHFMGVLVSSIEVSGIILLTLGLLTRFIAVLLSFVMLGAIFFVHIGHGFSVANNGYEIALYYLIFLLVFASFGPGKYSLDHLLFGEGKDA